MAADMIRITIGVVCVVAVLLSLVEISEANYKNAPMNGIMFGKRGPTSGEAIIYVTIKMSKVLSLPTIGHF